MTAKVISDVRELGRGKHYVVSHHAANELDDDGLTIFDLECIVLTGKITHRQRDQNTHEIKYIISGDSLDGFPAEVVVKIGATGKLIFITVYLV